MSMLESRTEDDITWLTLNATGSTHTLDLELIRALEAELDAWAASPPRAVVIESARMETFLPGRSASDLRALLDPADAEVLLDHGQRLLARIAALPFPVAALVRGHCRDAGLELALACRYRIAEPAASFGFPEIHLGLHPGFGSTARLPDLIGQVAAFKLMTSGETVSAARAQQLHLIDQVADMDQLVKATSDLLRTDPGRHEPDLRTRIRCSRPARWLARTMQWSPSTERFRPERFPATAALTRLDHTFGSAKTARRIEAEKPSVLALLAGAPTRNIIEAFLQKDALTTQTMRADSARPARVLVVGAGRIGGAVATALAQNGIATELHDIDPAATQSVLSSQGEDVRLEAKDDLSGLEHADLIIECITESTEKKLGLLAAVESVISPKTVIVSTSATLPVDDLTRSLRYPNRLIGLHFFPPVASMPLVEVMPGTQTDESTIERGLGVIGAMQKFALVTHSRNGSAIWRLIMAYLLAGSRIYRRERREMIDTAARYFGFPMGPLEMADTIGLDVVLQHAEQMADPPGGDIPEALRAAVAAGTLGSSTGSGFHDWRNGRQVTASLPPGTHDFDAIAWQLMEPIIQEAAHCRDEGWVQQDEQLNAGAILSFGFPAWTGGPLQLQRP